MITNLPVREGETVVIGIQNAPGSTLMTFADMSVITAEVKVDETDIVNVKLGQPAEVSIDAIPKKVFNGIVTEIGNNAIVRSTGVSTSQSTSRSQEAKDFKVVVTLQDPPADLRPGLSTTAKITTATPQQRRGDSDPGTDDPAAERPDAETQSKERFRSGSGAPEGCVQGKQGEELQGVFVYENKKAAVRTSANGHQRERPTSRS